jgi:hypothetical protein
MRKTTLVLREITEALHSLPNPKKKFPFGAPALKLPSEMAKYTCYDVHAVLIFLLQSGEQCGLFYSAAPSPDLGNCCASNEKALAC